MDKPPPRVKKCDMCYDRQAAGKPTACTEACPAECHHLRRTRRSDSRSPAAAGGKAEGLLPADLRVARSRRHQRVRLVGGAVRADRIQHEDSAGIDSAADLARSVGGAGRGIGRNGACWVASIGSLIAARKWRRRKVRGRKEAGNECGAAQPDVLARGVRAHHGRGRCTPPICDSCTAWERPRI